MRLVQSSVLINVFLELLDHLTELHLVARQLSYLVIELQALLRLLLHLLLNVHWRILSNRFPELSELSEHLVV